MQHEKLRDWLFAMMRDREWSQAEIARRCGMSVSTLSRLINGNRGVGLQTCLQLSDGLNVSIQLVLTKAGLVPEAQITPEQFEALRMIYQKLPEQDQRDLLAIAESRLKFKRK